jgi:hypothetical protein
VNQIVAINAVVKSQRIVDVVVDTGRSQHRIGHLPSDGWFCICAKGKRCKHIDTVKQLVPEMETP